MVRNAFRTAAALSLVAGTVTTFAATSRGDDVITTPPPGVVAAPAAPPVSDTAQTRTVSTGPNLWLIGGGVFTLGFSYGVGIAVASNSDHHGDRHLYVPVIGPWLDLGDRGGGDCSLSGSCDRETLNGFLIAADGVFQALGVLSVVSGFVFEPKRDVVTTTTTASKPTFHITPVEYAHGGLGLAAFGTF